jgi:hypothetical protein
MTVKNQSRDETVELNLVTLDCGHAVAPDIGMGICIKCDRTCCSRCLQIIDGKLFCPDCFVEFVGKEDGDS